MASLWFNLVCCILVNIISGQHEDVLDENHCANHWLNINSTCDENDNYYSPTIAIQTLSNYANTNSLRSYTKISLLINANHDVIITPHCISMDITINPTIINYLAHEWLLNKVEWPSLHRQGEIITFSFSNAQSQYITFNEPCILTPNTTNALILLFNTNFDAYNIEIHNTQHCEKKNGITIYDKLYNTNTNVNNKNHNCFPMQSDARWNLYVQNGTSTIKQSGTDIYSNANVNGNNSDNSLVIALIVIIVLINIASCVLLWYFNQKQLSKNIKEISHNIGSHFNDDDENENENETKHMKIKDNTTTVISSLSESKRMTSINTNKTTTNRKTNTNNLPILSPQNNTNNTANTANTIIWVNKSYFDSNHMDDHNLFNQSAHTRNITDDSFLMEEDANNNLQLDEKEQNHNNTNNNIQNDNLNMQNDKLNKLRILLPHGHVHSHSRGHMHAMYNNSLMNSGICGSPSNTTNLNTLTTLTAITLSDECDWKTPDTINTVNTLNTLNTTPYGINNINSNMYIMDEIINENEATPIGKPSLQIGFRSNESNKSTNSLASSTRLPAYHPNKIKVMNDNKHIPYNKQFIIAVTPPYTSMTKPSLYKMAYNSNNSNYSNKSNNSLALPTHTSINNHQTNIHK